MPRSVKKFASESHSLKIRARAFRAFGLLGLLGLAACSTPITDLPQQGLQLLNGNAFSQGASAEKSEIILANNPGSLNPTITAEAMIRNVLDLARQKRFSEARNLIAELREEQPRSSEGYQGATAMMAVLALKEGDFPMFKRLARQLDKSLGKPVRVDAQYVELISLYRATRGESLPVNAPDQFQKFASKYFAKNSDRS